MQKDYIEIGYTKKAQGVKGLLKVKIEDEYLQDFSKTPVVFLELNEGIVPFFIEKRFLKGEPQVQFEDVDSKEKALKLASTKILMRPSDMIPKDQRKNKKSDLDFGFLEGYLMIDEEIGEIGEVVEVVAFPEQEMAYVNYEDREVMIPLNVHLILGIDEKQNAFLVDLPDGLLDLQGG